MIDEFLGIFPVHFLIAFVACLLIPVMKLSLRDFTFFYILLVGVKSTMGYLIGDPSIAIKTLIFGVIALIIVLLITGFVGTRINSVNYSSLLAFIGLVSWWYSIGLSIALIIITLLITSVYGIVKQRRAFKSLGYNQMPNLKVAAEKMGEEKFALFSKRSSIVLSIPFAFGILLTTLLYSL